MRDLVIIGAGSFGEDMLDNIRLINEEKPIWNVVGFIDDVRTGEVDGVSILGKLEDFLKMDKTTQYFVAIFNGRVRERIMNTCKAAGFTAAVIIGHGVIREENVVIEEGSYVGSKSCLMHGCRIGTGVILEHAVTICAEAYIGEYTTCRIFANVGRAARVGRYNTFDLRCTVDDGVVTAEDCTFQIGSVVMKNADVAGLYAGIPAKAVIVR